MGRNMNEFMVKPGVAHTGSVARIMLQPNIN